MDFSQKVEAAWGFFKEQYQILTHSNLVQKLSNSKKKDESIKRNSEKLKEDFFQLSVDAISKQLRIDDPERLFNTEDRRFLSQAFTQVQLIKPVTREDTLGILKAMKIEQKGEELSKEDLQFIQSIAKRIHAMQIELSVNKIMNRPGSNKLDVMFDPKTHDFIADIVKKAQLCSAQSALEMTKEIKSMIQEERTAKKIRPLSMWDYAEILVTARELQLIEVTSQKILDIRNQEKNEVRISYLNEHKISIGVGIICVAAAPMLLKWASPETFQMLRDGVAKGFHVVADKGSEIIHKIEETRVGQGIEHSLEKGGKFCSKYLTLAKESLFGASSKKAVEATGAFEKIAQSSDISNVSKSTSLMLK